MLGQWSKIASSLSTKLSAEVQEQYEKLVDDVNLILSGWIQLPHYADGSLPRKSPASSLTRSSWNWEVKKQFLEALEAFPDGTEGTQDRWNKITSVILTKSPA
ncbi:uncharacterized protein LOC131159197 [Malania oleifera]|uniref:uncharacterized protein LOC131159197 n=1 Tax=Malania oleifera TaxID=397392 RepID=UPI0025ADCD93|nr:uncharacterized protein LOC131159197 [Malania oleifera]